MSVTHLVLPTASVHLVIPGTTAEDQFLLCAGCLAFLPAKGVLARHRPKASILSGKRTQNEIHRRRLGRTQCSKEKLVASAKNKLAPLGRSFLRRSAFDVEAGDSG